MGSWVTYGLGTENENLQDRGAYLQRRATERGSKRLGSGFLPPFFKA